MKTTILNRAVLETRKAELSALKDKDGKFTDAKIGAEWQSVSDQLAIHRQLDARNATLRVYSVIESDDASNALCVKIVSSVFKAFKAKGATSARASSILGAMNGSGHIGEKDMPFVSDLFLATSVLGNATDPLLYMLGFANMSSVKTDGKREVSSFIADCRTFIDEHTTK